MKLKIPWKSLGSSSVIVEVSDVYLLVRPKKCCVWNDQEEQAKQTLLKRQKLDAFDFIKDQQDQKKSKLEDSTSSDGKKPDPGFLEKLTETVINNLQVRINNIHVRYEDPSDQKNPIVFGFTLDEIEVSSCDSFFKKIFVTETTIGQKVYKLLEMKDLSIYMNNFEKSLFSFNFKDLSDLKKTMSDFQSLMKSYIKKEAPGKVNLLQPINGILKLSFIINNGLMNGFKKWLVRLKIVDTITEEKYNIFSMGLC